MAEARAEVTNRQIADDLGVTHAAISRIRSGDRTPSIELMMRISVLVKWSIDQQARAKSDGTYAAAFEKHMSVHYHPGSEFTPPVTSYAG